MSPEQVLGIIEKMYGGNMITHMLPTDKERYAFYTALKKYPDLMNEYEEAQRTRAELAAEEVLHIADTEPDYVKSRNQIDARKWYASKIKPQKFGDKVQVDHTHTIDLNAALIEAKTRAMLPNSDQPRYVHAQVIDTPSQRVDLSTDQQSVDMPTPNVESVDYEDIFG